MQPTYPSIPADGAVTLSIDPADNLSVIAEPVTLQGEPVNSFIDSDGDTFWVAANGPEDSRALELCVQLTEPDELITIEFYKSDATKIIALIAEAAKDEPRVLSQQEVADFAHRWDARVEEGRK